MQAIVKDSKKDRARPAHPDTHSKPIGEKDKDDRLKKFADNVTGRGRERERKDDEQHGIFSK